VFILFLCKNEWFGLFWAIAAGARFSAFAGVGLGRIKNTACYKGVAPPGLLRVKFVFWVKSECFGWL